MIIELIREHQMQLRICYKCKVEFEIVYKPQGSSICVNTRHHYACKECFMNSVVRMFRGQVHKLGIPRKSRLVIAYSGGSCSRY